MATRDFSDRESLVLAARMTHNQEIIDVAEVLNETNDIVSDAVVQRANDITSHVMSRRTALPAVNWVKVGNGWNATTGLLNQVREEMGMLKARYLAPEDVMRIQPDPAKYRMQQERAYIESMGQELANTLVGNVSAGALSPATNPPEEFAGFQLRYPTLSTADTAYVLSNGGSNSGGHTSIWFVQWGPGKVYLIHPRNTDAGGLRKQDKGLQLVSGDNAIASTSAVVAGQNPTNQLWAFISEFSWDVGLAVEDLRTVKRLANIDTAANSSDSLNEDFIIQIRNNFKTNDMIMMYVNETVFTQLQILAKDKTNVHWPPEHPFGKPQMFFLDMPVRRCDAITNVEGTIS
ncbi:hypothetical protein LCGC14_1151050 [marine sediment metagenome]|uniref:Major capsid protein n=1 Tax=marine sediment metagenome TaxID=412755 RepID=A0A0F9M0E2_9ZZZZ